jgi:hypothetical protein
MMVVVKKKCKRKLDFGVQICCILSMRVRMKKMRNLDQGEDPNPKK